MQELKIKDLILSDKNPRNIHADKLELLKKSIQEFPEMLNIRPVVVDEKNVVLGGNMRVRAMKELGHKVIQAIIVKDLTEEQKKEFIIKDNVGFGEWDWDILANEWDADLLEEWGLDGFPFDNETELEAEEDDYTEPDNMKVDVVLGDLIEIGEHRLLCGDSTDSDQVAKLMNGQKADMVFTDPPYGMNLDTNYADIYKNSIANVKNQDRIIGDDKDFNFIDFYALFEYVKEQFWWGADYYQNQLPSNGGIFVWDKVCESMEGRIGNEFELCWSKQRHKKEIIHIKWAGFLGLQKEDGKRQHPTQKPIRLCESFISRFSKESNLLIDPFLGSGSTMVASHQLKRKCYGIELDPKYCQVIINRMLSLDPSLEVKRNGVLWQKTN